MKSPFKFLDAFTISDKDAFFGRDQEIETLYNIVYKTPLVLVYGSSGTGKTSLIQCGLANRFDGPDWYPIFIRRNDNLNDSVKEAMALALGDLATGNLTEDASLLLRKSLRPVYLLFDQFEELFISGEEEEQIKFMTSLRGLLDTGLACKVVLIMREEFIARLYNFEDLIPELFDHRFRVEVMGPSKVKKVISASFDKFNIQLAEPKEALLDLMVSKINDPKTGIALPYLQVYLDMLYRDVYKKKIKGNDSEELPALEITEEDIESLGQINNVLERFLENQTQKLKKLLVEKYTSFDPKEIQSVLNIFVTDEGTKSPVSYKMEGDQIVLSEKATLQLKDISGEMQTDMINSLVAARILRKEDKSIEVAHDSLALIINRRKSASDRFLQNVQKRLNNAYEEYRKTGAYLNEKQLAAFDEFKSQLAISPALEKFLADCESELARQKTEEQERSLQESKMAQQKKLTRVRTILISIIGLLIIGAIFSYSIFKGNQKDELIRMKEENINEVESKSKILEKNMTEIDQQIDILESFILNDTSFIRSEEEKNEFRNILKSNNYNNSRSTLFMEPLFAELNKYIANNGRFNELDQILTSLKSIVRADSLELDNRNSNFATVKERFTTNNPQDDPSTATKDSVLTSERVSISIHLTTPQPKETIQVKWLTTDGKIVAKPSYFQITQDSSRMAKGDTTGWFSFGITLPAQASYLAEIYNREGIIIGSYKFRIDTTATGNNTSPGNNSSTNDHLEFITMKTGSLQTPGESTKNFSVGDKLSYWLSIRSDKDEKVAVQLIDNTNKVIWNDEYLVEKNPVKGSRVYSWHGANQAGTYYIKVINVNGAELVGFPVNIR